MNRLPDTTGMPNEVITGPFLRCYIPIVNVWPVGASCGLCALRLCWLPPRLP
jgi:hypothetical protein